MRPSVAGRVRRALAEDRRGGLATALLGARVTVHHRGALGHLSGRLGGHRARLLGRATEALEERLVLPGALLRLDAVHLDRAVLDRLDVERHADAVLGREAG